MNWRTKISSICINEICILRVPNLRFPEFDGEWEVKKLGEVAEIQSGFAFKSEHFSDTGIKLVIPKNFTKSGFGNFDDSISKFSRELPSINYKCKENDLLILLTDLTPSCELLGKPLFIKKENGEVWLNQRIIRLDLNDEILKNWLLYFLQTENYHKLIKETASGSTVRHSSNKIISSVIFSSTSLQEQTKIASFLSLIDERISTQNKIIEELKILKATLAQKIFTQKLRFKDDKGIGFSDWEVKKLVRIGTFFSGGTPLTSKKHYFNGDIPFIRSGEINANYTEQYISKEGLKNSSAKMIEVGDLIYALYGATSGEVGISRIEGAINQAILCIRSNQNNVFLLNYLRIQKENIINTYLQGGQGNLSAEIIKSLEIPIPSLEEQTKIANFLSQIDEKIDVEKQLLIQYKNQKKHLLQNLFI